MSSSSTRVFKVTAKMTIPAKTNLKVKSLKNNDLKYYLQFFIHEFVQLSNGSYTFYQKMVGIVVLYVT